MMHLSLIKNTKMNKLRIIYNGLVVENPTFVLLLGMCPTLGTTGSAMNGMSMGLATAGVLVCAPTWPYRQSRNSFPIRCAFPLT